MCITVIVDNQAGVDALSELDFCLLGTAAALPVTYRVRYASHIIASAAAALTAPVFKR